MASSRENAVTQLHSASLLDVAKLKQVIKDDLETYKDSGLLNLLVDDYIQSGSDHLTEILIGVSEPHDKHLMEKLAEYTSPEHRLKMLELLGHLIYRQPVWLHKITQQPILSFVIGYLKTETDITVLVVSVLIVASLLPSAPVSFAALLPGRQASHLNHTLVAFLRLCDHLTTLTSEEHASHLRFALFSLFTRLYGMYPWHFLNYVRFACTKQNRERSPGIQLVVKPFLSRVRFHHLLVSQLDQEFEKTKARFQRPDADSVPDEIRLECSNLAIDAGSRPELLSITASSSAHVPSRATSRAGTFSSMTSQDGPPGPLPENLAAPSTILSRVEMSSSIASRSSHLDTPVPDRSVSATTPVAAIVAGQCNVLPESSTATVAAGRRSAGPGVDALSRQSVAALQAQALKGSASVQSSPARKTMTVDTTQQSQDSQLGSLGAPAVPPSPLRLEFTNLPPYGLAKSSAIRQLDLSAPEGRGPGQMAPIASMLKETQGDKLPAKSKDISGANAIVVERKDSSTSETREEEEETVGEDFQCGSSPGDLAMEAVATLSADRRLGPDGLASAELPICSDGAVARTAAAVTASAALDEDIEVSAINAMARDSELEETDNGFSGEEREGVDADYPGGQNVEMGPGAGKAITAQQMKEYRQQACNRIRFSSLNLLEQRQQQLRGGVGAGGTTGRAGQRWRYPKRRGGRRKNRSSSCPHFPESQELVEEMEVEAEEESVDLNEAECARGGRSGQKGSAREAAVSGGSHAGHRAGTRYSSQGTQVTMDLMNSLAYDSWVRACGMSPFTTSASGVESYGQPMNSVSTGEYLPLELSRLQNSAQGPLQSSAGLSQTQAAAAADFEHITQKASFSAVAQSGATTSQLPGRRESQAETELQSRVRLLETRLCFERREREIHALRNRRLLAKILQHRKQEDNVNTLQSLLQQRDLDLHGLREDLGKQLQRCDATEREALKRQTVQELRVRELGEKNVALEQRNQRLQLEQEKFRERNSALEEELDRIQGRLFQMQHQLEESEQQVKQVEALREQVMKLNKELLLIGELHELSLSRQQDQPSTPLAPFRGFIMPSQSGALRDHQWELSSGGGVGLLDDQWAQRESPAAVAEREMFLKAHRREVDTLSRQVTELTHERAAARGEAKHWERLAKERELSAAEWRQKVDDLKQDTKQDTKYRAIIQQKEMEVSNLEVANETLDVEKSMLEKLSRQQVETIDTLRRQLGLPLCPELQKQDATDVT